MVALMRSGSRTRTAAITKILTADAQCSADRGIQTYQQVIHHEHGIISEIGLKDFPPDRDTAFP